MGSPKLLDRDWVRRSFLVSAEDKENALLKRRFYSSASVKYVDTCPGGNVMINPPPQFTRLADIKPKSIRKESAPGLNDSGLMGGSHTHATLGRYYSEAIDDNAHLVHFRMGKTGYTSVLRYLTSFYTYQAGYLARTGRAPGFFYNLGRIAGMVVAVVNWKFVATMFLWRMIRFVSGIPNTKYAYLKPTMPVYWAAVQSMVNHIATYRGLVTIPSGVGEGSGTPAPEDAAGYDMDAATARSLHAKMPDIYGPDGTVNVYAIATKGQRIANAVRRQVREALDNANSGNYNKEIVDQMARVYSVQPSGGLSKLMDTYFSTTSLGLWGQLKSLAGVETRADMLKDSNSMAAYFEAEMRDGSSFVTFRVDEGGSVSESFSNSAAESQMKSKIDGMAASVRSTINMWAGGNIDDGIVGTTVGGALSAVKDFVGGKLDSLGLGGLAMIGSGGYADIPQHWESSSANMPRMNYTIKLRAAYRNPYSVLVNETIPLCMLLAMVLPNSTGPQSYTGPFMLEFFDQSRGQTRYGMVDSLSITRGTASTPFGQDRMYHGIEVNLSILDLTNNVHMPLSEGFKSIQTDTGTVGLTALAGINAIAGEEIATGASQAVGALETAGNALATLFTDDTNFTDYMAILSGLGVMDNIYASRKMRLRLTRAFAEWRTHYSKPAIAMAYGDSAIGQLMRTPFRGSEKLF